ncbi:MAG: hypothetical protein HY528_00670 [Chloroflexi bacterium]|nr:hypothetical protein [Chloroflexota bacterium]
MAFMIIMLLPQSAMAQERQIDLTLRLVPNRANFVEVEAGKDNMLFLEVNNIGNKAITGIRLSSDKTEGWVIDFKPGNIDSLNPGSLQTVNVNIRPPGNIAGGEHAINIIAEANEIRKVENFSVTIKLTLLTLNLLSPNRLPFPSELRAGQDNAFLLEVNNIGNKAITDIKLSADKLEGWVIDFNPGKIDSLDPGRLQTVNVNIKPPNQATKERHQITFIAESNETRQLVSFFVTVKPAQLWIWVWIIAGVIVIAGFVFIYQRFGGQK